MLYINGEHLATSNKSKDYKFAEHVEDYIKTVKDLKEKFGEFITVKTKHPSYKDRLTGALRHPGPRGLLVKSNAENQDGGIDEWVYSPNILKKVDEELVLPNPNLLIYKGELVINIKENPDLAYFVYKKSRQVGKGINDGKKYYIFDEEFDNTQAVEEYKKRAKVMHLIFEAIPEANLRILAKSWGIGTVDTKNLNTVRKMLFDKIEAAEAMKRRNIHGQRGFDEFIESADVKVIDKISAQISDAVDRGMLVFSEKDRAWTVDYRDGNEPYLLKELSGDEFGNKEEALALFLHGNETAMHKLNLAMGIKSKVNAKEDVELTIEAVEGENRIGTIKGWVKQHVPEYKQNNKDTLKGLKEVLIRKIIGELATEETKA